MEILELLSEIDRIKAEIDALRPLDPAQERHVMQKFRLDWTYHSNAIEGNTLTYGETKTFLLHGVTAQGKPFRDYLEIKGHHEAINTLLEFVCQQRPLTEADIRELHKMILVEPYEVDAVTPDGKPTKKRVMPGQYKTAPNHVATSTGEMHYYATPEETPAKMGDLMAWYRRETDKAERHPLILAATFHYQFVVIHPFDDGNGRMARLLMNLILLQYRYPPVIIPIDKKGSYLLALETADAEDNLEPFIIHIGEGLLHSLDLYLRGAQGERIEELDDLDKKVALLEKSLQAHKMAQKPEKNSAILKELYDQFLISLISLLLSQLSKFDRLFVRKNLEFQFIDQSGFELPRHTFSESQQAVEDFREFVSVHIDLSGIVLFYEWKEFKSGELVTIWFRLSIEFQAIKFKISYNAIGLQRTFTLIDDYYDSTYSEEEMGILVQMITEKLIEVIREEMEIKK
ncbi:MAG: Fic family protein [Chloroflexi bacterium]|nr:Fic family protein [Chloroflexota bacterium]